MVQAQQHLVAWNLFALLCYGNICNAIGPFSQLSCVLLAPHFWYSFLPLFNSMMDPATNNNNNTRRAANEVSGKPSRGQTANNINCIALKFFDSLDFCF
jgi:hypothetical protein